MPVREAQPVARRHDRNVEFQAGPAGRPRDADARSASAEFGRLLVLERRYFVNVGDAVSESGQFDGLSR